MDDTPTPLYVTVPWLVLVISCLSFYLYLRFKPSRTTMYGPQELQNENKEKVKKNY